MATTEVFKGVPARRLLAAAAREQRAKEQGAEVRGMLTLAGPHVLGGADSLLDELSSVSEEQNAKVSGKGLTLSIKEIWIDDIHEGWFSGKGEVYIVTSMLAGSSEQPDFKTKDFQDIAWGDRLPLGEGGMLVGLIKDPAWFVDFHLLVMESDSDLRELGKTIAAVRADSGLNDAIELAGKLAMFDPTGISQITTAVDIFLSGLSAALKANGDDHIATIHDFYLAAQGWGIGRHPPEGTTKWQDAKAAYQIDLEDI